jgi:hypothetical protein
LMPFNHTISHSNFRIRSKLGRIWWRSLGLANKMHLKVSLKRAKNPY